MKKYKISHNWNPGGPYDFGYKSNFTIEIEKLLGYKIKIREA